METGYPVTRPVSGCPGTAAVPRWSFTVHAGVVPAAGEVSVEKVRRFTEQYRNGHDLIGGLTPPAASPSLRRFITTGTSRGSSR